MFKKKEKLRVPFHVGSHNGVTIVCLNDVIAFLYERGQKELAEEVRDRCIEKADDERKNVAWIGHATWEQKEI